MRFFFILLILISLQSIGQKTYYFDFTNGNDANNSTQAQSQATPWKTFSKFINFFSSLNAGDQVLFKRGEVFPASAFIVNKSGVSGNPITIGAYGSGAKPFISGMTTVAAWTNLGSNIWESTNPVSTLSTCNMVVENGVNTPMGRTPNNGWFTIDSHNGNTQITSTSIGSPNWTGGEVVIRKNHFVIDRGLITNQSGSTITYSSTGTDDAQDGYGFFIQNDVRTLDAQGEWYYNPSTKKLRIFSTSSPVNVQVPTIDRIIEMTNQHDLTFSNIYFNGSNTETFYIGSCQNISLQDCDFVFSGKNCIWGGSNFGSPSSNFRLENCTINHTNNNALTMANEFVNPVIRLNTVTNTALIVGAGVSGTQGSRGIYSFGVDGMLVEQNRYDSVGYIPVEFSGTNSIVQKNFITNYCLNKDDGGGIYAYQDARTGKKILDNIVLNGVGNGSGTADGLSAASAIYMDDDCGNVEIARNTGANCALMGLFLHNAHNINVHDNTFYNNEVVFGTLGAQASLISDGSAGPITGITMTNNKMISRTAGQYAATFSDDNTGIPGFFTTLNNNYYARPIDDNLTIHTLQNNYSVENFLTLSQWKTFSGLDGLSKKSPVSITNVNDLSFYYNETTSNKVISLNGTYIDVTGQTFVGSITLLPYTSAVLIFQSGGGVQPLSVNASFTTISCNGNLSNITAIATGGVTPYSFVLDGGSPQVGNTWSNKSAGTHTITVTDQQGTVASTTFTITQPTQISISESHTPITINGNTSTVTITASGGTGTKTYKIGSGSYQSSNVFSGVIAGTYTVTVKDANNCTNTITFTITQPSVLVVGSSVTTAITCNAGTGVITVTASGGTSPYTNTGTFSRAAGTWSFTVTDAGGASQTTTTTITQPTAITITESHTAIAINGGTSTVTITASGGTGTLNYKIGSGSYQSSNIFTGQVAGTYTVTVRDANLCTNTFTFTITQPTALVASSSSGTITCNNGTTTVTVSGSGGTPPYTGAGAFTVGAGTYTYNISDAGGATATTSITVTQPAAISISLSYGSAPATVTVTASGGVGSYQYQLDGGSYQSSNVFSGVAAGNHTMVVRDAPLCGVVKAFTVNASGTPLSISATPTNATCNGGNGSVTIGGSGGTAPYTGTGVFSRAAGTWSFTITDNVGATASTTVTLTQPAAIAIAAPSYAPIAANGGSTTVTITASAGVPAYTYNLDGGGYQGSNVFAGVLAGNHSIVVKDANNCTSTLLFSITQPGLLYISASPTAISCYGGNSTVTISGSGGTAPITVVGGSPQTKTAGTYTFSVTDAFGTQKDTIIAITQPTQISISVSTGTILTNGGNTTVTATASGGTGALSYKIDAGSYQGTGSFSGITAGTHTVTVRDANLCTNTNTFSITQPGALSISATPTLSSLVCYNDVTTVTVTATGGTTPITYGKNGAFQGSGTFNNVSAGTYTFSVKDAFNAQHDTLLTITQPTQISILQYIYSPITVFGGTTTIDVLANGGTGALMYKLDGGAYQTDTLFAGVSAGIHTVYVRDASLCVNSQSFTITQPVQSPTSYYLRKRGVKHRYINQ